MPFRATGKCTPPARLLCYDAWTELLLQSFLYDDGTELVLQSVLKPWADLGIACCRWGVATYTRLGSRSEDTQVKDASLSSLCPADWSTPPV